MKVFVTGVGGQLGYDVMNELRKRGYKAIGSDIHSEYRAAGAEPCEAPWPYISLDITDKAAAERVIEELQPDAVIHCAAWTAVDLAEEEENKAKVQAINADGTRNIAEAARAADAKMLYISTDYIFDGNGTKAWEPDCQDYAPLNVYGQSKLAGELAVKELLEKYFIIRIAWVFGTNGKNFIKTMLSLGQKYDTLRVVKDQIGTPTYTYDLARLLVDMAETEKYGIYQSVGDTVGLGGRDSRIAYFADL